jgi:hypothetical protein
VTTADALEAEAQRFAAELTDTVRAVVGDHVEAFRARAVHRPGLGRVSVHQEPRTGIPLIVDGAPLLNLTAEYRCVWDGLHRFLAVDVSAIKVYAGAKADSEPLFRYEYARSPSGDVPGAHVQIHGHRDALTFVMARSGTSSRRGQRLADRTAQGTGVPRMSGLHFPVGGSRFRPALEDVLDMLVRELGVDHQDGWRDASLTAAKDGGACRSPPSYETLPRTPPPRSATRSNYPTAQRHAQTTATACASCSTTDDSRPDALPRRCAGGVMICDLDGGGS